MNDVFTNLHLPSLIVIVTGRQKWFKMAEIWGNGMKTPINDSHHKIFEFGPLFGYHNFQNEIDTWETTVPCWFQL